MIAIQLGPLPAVLNGNEVPWGLEYESAINRGVPPPHRYRHEDIKDGLRVETHGKCAYCESRIEHVSFGHIEHILAKSREPQLVCTWTNLTLACQMCNSYKGGYFSTSAPILNPYQDDAKTQVVFYGPMAVERNDRAKLTITKLRLNRPELLFQRTERLRGVLRLFDLLDRSVGNNALATALAEELAGMAESSSEYSSCVQFLIDAEQTVRQQV